MSSRIFQHDIEDKSEGITWHCRISYKYTPGRPANPFTGYGTDPQPEEVELNWIVCDGIETDKPVKLNWNRKRVLVGFTIGAWLKEKYEDQIVGAMIDDATIKYVR